MSNMNEKHETLNDNMPATDNKHRRLLDMLAGWMAFHEWDVRNNNPEEAAKIADLYQKAGNLCNLASEAETDEFIAKFLNDDVLPVILGRK